MVTRKWYSHPVIAAGIAVNAFILALAVAWSGPDPTQLWRLLGEDGIVEWMQFLCFAVLSVMLAFVASERWKRSPRVSLDLLALGYAGWGAGQLEREIRENVWLTVEADEALVFDADHETKWTRALAKLRIDPKFLSAEGGRA